LLQVADTSGQDNSKSTTVPPPSVIDRVMKDLFSDGIYLSSFFA